MKFKMRTVVTNNETCGCMAQMATS